MQKAISPKHIWIIAVVAVMAAAGSFWLSLQDFHLFFLVPIILAAALYMIIRTDVFLILAGSLAPLSVNINDLGGGFGLSLPTEPIYIVLFLGFTFKFLLNGTIDKRLIRHPLTIIMFCYLLWLWITAAFSSMPFVSFKFCLSRTWYIVLFYFVFALIFKDPKKLQLFLLSFAITTVSLVLFVLIKHAADGFIRSSSYGVSWPFFPDHGMYAAAIAFAVSILVFATFNGSVFRLNYPSMVVAGIMLALLLFGIVVSYTRATWLSLIAALGVYVVLRLKISFRYVVLVLACASIYAMVNQDQLLYSLEGNKQGSSDELEGHVKSVSNITTDPSNLERINRWSCATRMAGERPLTGFGPGTFVFQYAPFQKSNELTIISTHSGDLGDAHSEYFSALAETGWPGLFLWLAIVLASFFTGFRICYTNDSRKVRILAMIALLGLVTYHVHAFLNNYSNYDKIAVPLWGFTAILVALDIYYSKKMPVANETPAQE